MNRIIRELHLFFTNTIIEAIAMANRVPAHWARQLRSVVELNEVEMERVAGLLASGHTRTYV